MFKLVLVIALCVVGIYGMPYEVIEDEHGQAFALLPVNRVRRQTSVDISKSNAGTAVTLGQSGTLFENDRHRLDGSAFASKQFKPSGPLTTGGQLGYTHIPTGSNLNVGASNTRGFGTDLGVQGTYNIYRDSRTSLGATGQYSRHFGGPFGTGRPNYGVGLQFQHRF